MSAEQLVREVEDRLEKRLVNRMTGYVQILDKTIHGKKRYPRQMERNLVEEANQTIWMLVRGDCKLYEKYKYRYVNGKLQEGCFKDEEAPPSASDRRIVMM